MPNKSKDPQRVRTRLCAMCKKQQRTGNAYCKGCDAKRKAEERGKVPEPETVEGLEVRGLVDKTFALLESEPGTEVEVRGVKMQSNKDGTVTFKPKNRDHRRRIQHAQEKLRALKGA